MNLSPVGWFSYFFFSFSLPYLLFVYFTTLSFLSSAFVSVCQCSVAAAVLLFFFYSSVRFSTSKVVTIFPENQHSFLPSWLAAEIQCGNLSDAADRWQCWCYLFWNFGTPTFIKATTAPPRPALTRSWQEEGPTRHNAIRFYYISFFSLTMLSNFVFVS